jgi:DNA adenine methylase
MSLPVALTDLTGLPAARRPPEAPALVGLPGAAEAPRPAFAPEAPRPFIKWVGGKRRLLPTLLEQVPRSFRRFHEPFLGGGAFYFAASVAFPRPQSPAVLADRNLRLIRTWRAVRDDVEGLIARLREYAAHHDRTQFEAVRALNPDTFAADAEVGAWFIYLNKTGYNGLYRVNRRGVFNVPFGRQSNPTICDDQNLRACARALAGVDLRHAAFDESTADAAPGDFVYFDPPYVPVSATADFTGYTEDGFSLADHARLRDHAATLAARGVHVVLSNADTPLVRRLYDGFRQAQVFMPRAVNRDAAGRGPVAELLLSAGPAVASA